MRLDKLTVKAQEALQAAQHLAEQRGHQEITPEHLLLAAIDQADGLVGRLLAKVGTDQAQLRTETERLLAAQPSVRGAGTETFLGNRLRAVLTDATNEAERLT